jgi:hypothetical protein
MPEKSSVLAIALILAGCGGDVAHRSTDALSNDPDGAMPRTAAGGMTNEAARPATGTGGSGGSFETFGGAPPGRSRPPQPAPGDASAPVDASAPPSPGDASPPPDARTDAGMRPSATVDSQGLPRATCRSGDLYAPLAHGFDSSSLPVELLLPAADRPDWAVTQNLMVLPGLTPPLSETYVRGPASTTCAQGDVALASGGMLVHGAPEFGVSVWTEKTAATPDCNTVQQSACHPHGAAGVTWDCGTLPEGAGGPIAPGVYALVGYVRYEGTSYPALGGYIVQTLYLDADGAFVVSYDDNNFGYAGASTYITKRNQIAFAEKCGSQPAMYRAFPAAATYTASRRTLELFDKARNVRSTYAMMD